jgi:putative flippase GtrA
MLSRPAADGRAARAFARATAAIARHLPFGLDRVVAPNLVGFALLNGTTFAVDLGLLALLHGTVHWPLPLAFTCAYAVAFGLGFALNRVLNFRSHAPVGGQLGRYLPIVIANYLVWVLGLGDGLAAAGLDYRLARVVAGLAEAAFLYCALRWIVFPARPEPRD